VLVPVVLSEASDAVVRVAYTLDSGLAFNGVDYFATGGTLEFGPGETVRHISVRVLDDSFSESAETLVLRLVRAGLARIGTPGTHTLTIIDNDVPPAVSPPPGRVAAFRRRRLSI
jgi:hypothetical protein